MRRLLIVAILLLCLPVWSEAQSCDGCGIGYRYNGVPATGGTFTGSVGLPDGTTSAPAIFWSGAPTLGLFRKSGDNAMTFATTGPSNTMTVGPFPYVRFSGSALVGWTNSADSQSNPDLVLTRDAANTLALRNGVNAQTFNVYNTYTDASNYERAFGKWTGNVFQLGVEKAGTGAARIFAIGVTASYTSLYTSMYPVSNDTVLLGDPSLAYQGFQVTRSIQGSKTKALTESSATTVATVAVPQTAGANFAAGEVRYTVYASDGTDTQTLNGSAFFSAINKAGTETCTLTDDQIGTEASSSGTLTCTVACAVGLTDVVGITFDCASSLTQTTLNALVRFDMQQPNTLVFP